MIPIPRLEDYDVSPTNGFLSDEPPLESLSDPYYEPWEHIIHNLQGLILSKRLHEVIDKLPILSTSRLNSTPQWRRAYSALAFLTHAYIWCSSPPSEWIPPPFTLPFLSTCAHLELPPVATYAGLVLWNWKPLFPAEPIDSLSNLDTLDTFTGSLDEKWFFLVSAAIEARGAPLIPLLLSAITAARHNDRAAVTEALRTFAERLDELGGLLQRMYDNCDPHVFYHRIRPYLAGSKNMADAGLPNGVVFDKGGPMNKQRHVQYSGGSNAQSSLIQFFDVALGITHRPTGSTTATNPPPSHPTSHTPDHPAVKKPMKVEEKSFHLEMRAYMPGPHARFLAAVERVANLRQFAQRFRQEDRELAGAFDAAVAMLAAFRGGHIRIVSRYVILPSQAAKGKKEKEAMEKMRGTEEGGKPGLPVRSKSSAAGGKAVAERPRKDLRGTGGTALIPFLRQARDETGEVAVDAWARRLLSKSKGFEGSSGTSGERTGERRGEKTEEVLQGLASVWHVDDSEGGLCLV
ncbi:hypothetical protein B0A54_14010 [Friedmanniomyces endolithicus]|uniref:Indoleamine 2,3-dioxygenase n=1 Tax=Friedmanniomyces endolithicus TaxID=329885 RepID=A0A4U0UHC7_9PEZI|nr:hypothetical protein B0A54_14010 [Friedmanniomyces endolithicus]